MVEKKLFCSRRFGLEIGARGFLGTRVTAPGLYEASHFKDTGKSP